jgi:hypothetical protein
MSMRERRILSAMTAEAREKQERLEAEGRDPLTGRPACEGTDCACEQKHGGGGAPEGGRRGRRGGAGGSDGAAFGGGGTGAPEGGPGEGAAGA